jgi:phosphoglycolate phosphatase
MSLSVDSIIFDLDGTLWDSTTVCFDAWESVINNFSHLDISISPTDIKSIAGTQHDLIFPTLFPHLTTKQCIELTHLCGQQELVFIKKHGAQLFDGVVETIKTFSAECPLFIVSNCQSGYIEVFLDYYQLDKFFTDFECSGRTLKSKSLNIKSIVDRNNLKTPIYVGDTQGDSEAAYENRIPFIYATYGFGRADRFDLKINSLKELRETINVTTNQSLKAEKLDINE